MSHRVSNSPQTDSRCTAEAVEGAFGCDVDYAMLIKLYGNDSFDTKYSPGECIGTQSAVLQGNPIPTTSTRLMWNGRTLLCACRCGGLPGSPTDSARN